MDEINDTLVPERRFLTAVEDALKQRRHSRVEKLIRQQKVSIPHASVTEHDYRSITGIRMRPLCRPRLEGRRDEPTDPLTHRRRPKPISPTRSGSAPAQTNTVSPTRGWTTSPAY